MQCETLALLPVFVFVWQMMWMAETNWTSLLQPSESPIYSRPGTSVIADPDSQDTRAWLVYIASMPAELGRIGSFLFGIARNPCLVSRNTP